ncbi:MAG TPA: hypothetical protein V6D17_25220 [Candidatus Obscuribacterales bacterium]
MSDELRERSKIDLRVGEGGEQSPDHSTGKRDGGQNELLPVANSKNPMRSDSNPHPPLEPKSGNEKADKESHCPSDEKQSEMERRKLVVFTARAIALGFAALCLLPVALSLLMIVPASWARVHYAYELASFYSTITKQWDKAVQYGATAERVFAVEMPDAPFLHAMDILPQDYEDVDNLILAATRAIKNDPQNSDLYYKFRGFEYSEQGDYAPAIADFDSAARLLEKEVARNDIPANIKELKTRALNSVYAWRGHVKIKNRDYLGALDDLNRVVPKLPLDLDTGRPTVRVRMPYLTRVHYQRLYIDRAIANVKSGRNDPALHDIDRAEEISSRWDRDNVLRWRAYINRKIEQQNAGR